MDLSHFVMLIIIPVGSMYAIYGNIYHQCTPNVSIYTIHGSYGIAYCWLHGGDSVNGGTPIAGWFMNLFHGKSGNHIY